MTGRSALWRAKPPPMPQKSSTGSVRIAVKRIDVNRGAKSDIVPVRSRPSGSLAAHSGEAFIDEAWQMVGRKVCKERLLSDISTTAAGSVGVLVHPESDAVRMVRMVLAEGRSLTS